MDDRRRLAGRFVLIGAAMAAALAGAVWPLAGDGEALTGALAALAVICAGLVHLWVHIDGRVVRPLRAERGAERRRLRAVLRGLEEGVIVCSADHRIALCNAAAARRLGEGRAAPGRPIGTVLDLAAIEGALGELASAEAPSVASLRDASGRALRIASIDEEPGERRGYVITLADAPGEAAPDGRRGGPGGPLPL